ncbi:protein of unknown function [Methylocella tundrae]|uniref:Uncharacterized protein n=1 Tax=Methylocella tundrae TaxID=227605 RepID=A0A4U8YTX2_METTU|nr:protein of unknown function [Methylocella tundrae]
MPSSQKILGKNRAAGRKTGALARAIGHGHNKKPGKSRAVSVMVAEPNEGCASSRLGWRLPREARLHRQGARS